MAEENRHQDGLVSDQHLQRWLSDRIVKLSLARYELQQMQERLTGLDQYLDFLATHSGKEEQPLPPAEVAEREALQSAVLAKTEAIQKAFEPTASQPFSLEEEMKIYCQTLIEVNERLAKHQPTKPSLRDLYTSDAGQPGQHHDQDHGLSP
jgi:hypothetical protein